MVDRRKLMQVSAAAMGSALFAPHVARAASKRIRIGHNGSPASAPQAACMAFAAFLAEKTDRRYEVETYPSSQLGNDTQMIRAVANSTLDATVPTAGLLGTYNADLELVEMPYLFPNVESARKALDGRLGAYYAELLHKSSLSVIGWGENGLRHITANKPIRTVADLKGLKLRIQAAKIHIESFKGLGAEAAPLTFSELPEALRTGQFEAQENSLGVVVANEFIVRSQTHLSMTGHVYTPFVFVFSADILDDMPAGDRALVRAAGAVAAGVTRKVNEHAATTGVDKLKAAGMTIVHDVDRAGFQRAMDGLHDRLANVVGADAMARVRGLIG